MNPAEFSCDRSGFRFPYTAPLPAVSWHRMRPPGLGTSPFHNVPSPTPRCEQMVRVSVNPHLLAAFPRRRYGRLTQQRMTRLIRVHGYYGPLFCIFVQGPLSRWLAPPTRPPARSPNGRLGPGDSHPIRLMSVPACHRRTLSADILSAASPRSNGRQKYVTEQGRNHAPYTKGNFQFERIIAGWRTRYPLLDLRLKR